MAYYHCSPTAGLTVLDSSVDHYLTIEDAVTAAELLLERLLDI